MTQYRHNRTNEIITVIEIKPKTIIFKTSKGEKQKTSPNYLQIMYTKLNNNIN